MKNFIDFINESKPDNESWYEQKIIDYFTKNKNINFSDIDKISNLLNLSKNEVLEIIFKILSSFLFYGKYNNYVREKGELYVKQQQLDKGIRFELEHTNSPIIAKRIALDHLVDCFDYYDFLEELENKCKKQNNI